MSARKYSVIFSDGEVPLMEQTFTTRKAAAEWVQQVLANTRKPYYRIEIGVLR